MRYFIIVVCCFVVFLLAFVIPVIEKIFKYRSLEYRKKQRYKCLQCKLMGPEYLKEMEEEDIKNVDCCFICYPTVPPCKHKEISLNEFVKEYTKRKDNNTKLINEKDISITIPSNGFEKEQLF